MSGREWIQHFSDGIIFLHEIKNGRGCFHRSVNNEHFLSVSTFAIVKDVTLLQQAKIFIATADLEHLGEV